MKKNIFFRFLALPVAAAAFFLTSCSKNNDGDGPGADYSSGNFIIMEGGRGSVDNGAIFFLDEGSPSVPSFRMADDIYTQANPGRKAGQLTQDIFVSGGKAYILSQNGTAGGGDGELVVLNARTFKVERFFGSLGFNQAIHENPQHIVVSGNKAYIQYKDGEYEDNSGIRVFDLASGDLDAAPIAGTYGTFGYGGANKGRMLLSKGKVYVPCGENLVIIDAGTTDVTATVPFAGKLIKDIIKGYDGYLYAAVTGEYTLPDYMSSFDITYNTPSSIVRIDHDGTVVSTFGLPAGIDLPAESWVSNVAMCADYTSNSLFFGGSYDNSTYSVKNIHKFDCTSGAVTSTIDIPATTETGNFLYGYMCVDPASGKLLVPVGESTYSSSYFATYDALTCGLLQYQNASSSVVYCSGIYNTYHFSSAYINK